MPKWLKILLTILAVALTNLVPIGYILIKYGITDTEIREIRIGGLSPFWIIIIAIIIASLLIWIIRGILIKWKQKIADKPFGSESRLLQQVILVFIFATSVLSLKYVINYIVTNTEDFLFLLNTYRVDMQWLLGFVFVGFLIDRAITLFE